SFTELRLRGLDLTLERGSHGRWNVRGLPGQQQPGGDPFAALEGLGELQVIGGKLAVIAPDLGIDAHLPRVDVRLRVDGRRVRAGMQAWMQPDKSPIEAVLDFDRDRGDGRAYFSAKRTELVVWSPLLRVAGVAVEGGNGRAEAWAELRRHRVAVVTVDAALDDLQLRGAPLSDARGVEGASRNTFKHVQARVRWRLVAGGWRLDAPTLRIGSGAQAQTLDGLVVAGGQHYGLVADRIDAGPLFAVLALSDRTAPDLRRWLLATKPGATLGNIVVAGNRGGGMRASGRIDAFGYAAVGAAPGLSGLAGELDGDDRGFNFVFDPARPLRIDWPRGFRATHVVTLHGQVAGWREGVGWRVATPALRIAGRDYGANLRGGLWFQGDGTRPWLELAAQLDDTSVAAAKGFWSQHLISPATVRWLDRALVSGRVDDGRALVSGDLDDWPFRDHDGPARKGVFKATARIADAVLKFHPDWPASDHVDADVAFVADGFSVSGQGVLADVGIRHFDAGIAHFGQSGLTVRAQGGGDASKLLGLLKQSPLQKQYGETIDNLDARGLAAVTFDLDLPLHANGGRTRLGGTVALAGARLSEKRWKLAFDGVRGRAEYGRGGFAADRLAVLHDGQPGKLSLRAGDYARDKRQAFEAELEASLPADELLDRVPQLGWLKPYLDGRSAWTVAVAILKSANAATQHAPPSRLQLRSNLVGTTLTLPAPLRKASGVALPTTIDAALPLGRGEIKVALGNLLALRARSGDKQTGVRVTLGSNTVAEAPPASGLIASGHAATLDALDWIAVAKGDNSVGNSLPLRRIDVSVDRLLLLGAAFPDARLQVTPAPGGISVQVQGDALAGSVRVPDGSGATISGQFERVHWRSATPAAAAGNSAATGSNGLDIDPVKVPPLSLDIADLRFGSAALGSAMLRTHPLAGGMRIEQLQMRAPKQRIDIHGDWLGRRNVARTRLGIDLDSDDFGALLAGFGYGGQLAGGNGKASFDASWPGSPAAFRLDALDGTLTLAARNGQLTELEPGAGRMLGLLSLAQLPRRLTLDFHDFFSRGFAFDRIDGDVRISGGQAHSDNLVIDGPAAEIRIRGAVDLRAQQFDQTIEVLPKAGNLLTVAGAIAGGPIGAAIGAAANAMLKKPLGRLGAKTYRVTGPWKEPKVEIVGREQSRVTAAQTSPPAG
ncbi:MAG: YhdP family protein, partial [Luteimonas sp.]